MPDSTASPPTSAAAAGSELDRLQSEVGDLLKEARLTQAAIQQLQASASTKRTVDVLPLDLGGPGFDAPLAFAGIGIVLALVAGTWWFWRKNLIHRSVAEEELDSEPMISAPAHPQKAQDHPPAQTPAPARAAEPSTSFDSFDSGFMDSAFYTPDPPGETSQTPIEAPGAFDSEAAASEVMRVRNSLAEKRRARAMLRLQEDATRTLQARERHEEVTEEQRHNLDIDLDQLALVPLSETQPPEHEPVPVPVPIFEPLAEPEPLPLPLPVPDPAVEPDFAPVLIPTAMAEVEQPELFPSPVETTDACPPEPPSASAEDDAIKLELAQEAVLLDLLPQARELALEVLEGGDTRLASEVEALISRIDQIESESKQAQLQWNEAP